jgi:class 3 adenylate cyclase
MTDLDPILFARLSKFLDSELLEAFPEKEAIKNATQHLNSLQKAIASFLPPYVVEEAENLEENRGSLTPGSLMFADVSGFTRLSELLKIEAGAEGIEVLTLVINDYFATMLEILAKFEGQLLKFAGDALLTFFPNDRNRDKAAQAVKAGLLMQRAMKERFQPIQNERLKAWLGEHDLSLTMSIGICRGVLFEALVGSLAQRDHIILGHLPGQALDAEGVGVRDEVIVDAELNAYLLSQTKDVFSTQPLAEGFYQVLDTFGPQLDEDFGLAAPQRRRAKSSFVFAFDAQDALAGIQAALEAVEKISRYVSSEVVNKLVATESGAFEIESENRLAVVIFVHFSGFAELLEALGEAHLALVTTLLSRYYTTMQRIISINGGVLTRTDPYQLGSKILITFGAPIAYPDDPQRAVQTALEMKQALERLNQDIREELALYPEFAPLLERYPFIYQRMGITQGEAYAGQVGWKQRREYTVMGDDVNLAARLMARAKLEDNEIIINQSMYERVSGQFATVALEPFKAKGKQELVQHHRVLGLKDKQEEKAPDTPFIGREILLGSLKTALMKANRPQKQAQLIGLYGDIGVGKTRLAREVRTVAQFPQFGFKTAWVTCLARQHAKATWASMVVQLLNLHCVSEPAEQQALLQKELEALGLVSLYPALLSLVFNIRESAPQKSTPRSSPSRRMFDIFDKLAADPGGEKPPAQMMRQPVRRSAAGFSINWDELEMGTSYAEALSAFFSAYTRQYKTLLVIDDFHKEHPRALKILRYLMNNLKDTQLVILTTYEPPHNFEVKHRIAVSDLPEEKARLLASAVLGGRELSPELGRYIWNNTRGRAMFIESLLQRLQTDNALTLDGSLVGLASDASLEEVPADIRRLVISQLDRLPNQARALLRSAAVLGDSFSEEALFSLTDNLTPQAATKARDELLDLQILEAIGEREYHFRHGIMEQAIYEELNRLQRQKLHLRAADYFAHQPPSFETILAAVHHFLRGGRYGWALDSLQQHIQSYREQGRLDEALALCERSLDFFPEESSFFDLLQALRAEKAS